MPLIWAKGMLASRRCDCALVLNIECGVPQHFPEVSVRVLEVTRIAAPKRVLRFHDDTRTGGASLLDNAVDFLTAAYGVADAAGRCRINGQPGLPGQVLALPRRED